MSSTDFVTQAVSLDSHEEQSLLKCSMGVRI